LAHLRAVLPQQIYPAFGLKVWEKQRIFLAKTLAQISMKHASSDNRRYLLLDEPTASLDLKQAQIVMRILRKAADEGIGVIVILHDLASTRRYGDKVFILKEGTVSNYGNPTECLTKENVSQVFDIELTTADDSLHEII